MAKVGGWRVPAPDDGCFCFLAHANSYTLSPAEFPIFFTVTSMQEHVSTMAEANEHESREPIATASPVKVQPTRVETKCALLWSHHLLAMSKRKDIQHWSVELKLWSLTKIG